MLEVDEVEVIALDEVEAIDDEIEVDELDVTQRLVEVEVEVEQNEQMLDESELEV